MSEDLQNENKPKTDQKIKPPKLKSCFGVRHVQMLMAFLLIFISYGTKVNLSIGIVAMTDSTDSKNSKLDSKNPKLDLKEPKSDSNIPTFSWNNDEKSLLLSSLFIGYILPQIFVGQLIKKYGPKWILAISMGWCSLFTFAIPKSAQFGIWYCISCRFLQGFTQGFFYPCIHHLLSKWIPSNERSTMGAFVYSGLTLGIVFGMLLTGELSSTSFGWPSAFYLYALFGLVWTIVWCCIGQNSPLEHENIPEDEKLYIINSYGYSKDDQDIPTPWKEILLSRPFWGILIAHWSQGWTFFMLMNELPTYMSTILEFTIEENGLLTALAYFITWMMTFPFAIFADYIINRKILQIGNTRKLLTIIGFLGPSLIFLILTAKPDLNQTTIYVLFIIVLSVNSATLSGFHINHIDISPNHSSTLIGITNTFANLSGIITPMVVDLIVVDEQDWSQWNQVFLLGAGIYFISCMFYIAFGSGEIQNWDKVDNK